jgi:hypothetical protein
VIILLGTALTLGFLHGLGADHLMAIAALAVSDGRTASSRTFGVALRLPRDTPPCSRSAHRRRRAGLEHPVLLGARARSRAVRF